jgi:tetratricopeptide (TPR) repeat protein
MAGGVVILPLAFSYLKNKYFIWAITFIALTLTLISWNRLNTFTTNYTLWDDAAKLVTASTPGADRIFFNRGQAAAKLRIWNTAESDLKLSTIINPTVSIARYELGMVYLNRGKNIEALQEFDVGIKLSPEDGSLYLGKGLALLRLGKKKEGQDSINKACELNDGTACLLATTNNRKNLTN